MKKLIMLGFLIGAFLGGIYADRHIIHLTDQIERLATTIYETLNTLNTAWATRGSP